MHCVWRELSTDVLAVLLSFNSTPDKHGQNTKNNICIRHTRKIVVGFLLFLLDCIVEDLSVWTIHSIHLPNFDLGGNIPTDCTWDYYNNPETELLTLSISHGKLLANLSCFTQGDPDCSTIVI